MSIRRKFGVCQRLVRYANVEYVHRLIAERRMVECTTATFFYKVVFGALIMSVSIIQLLGIKFKMVVAVAMKWYMLIKIGTTTIK